MFTGKLLPFQQDAFEMMLDRRKLLLAATMGSGKGCPPEAVLPSPDGPLTYGSVKVGDRVFGADGTPTRVTGVHPRGEQDLFRVTLSDGVEVVTDADHLWSVTTPTRRYGSGSYLTMSSRELASTPLRGRPNAKSPRGNRKFFLPMCAPVQYPEVDLPVDPYVLGALLGDGGLTNGVRLTNGEPDGYVVTRVAETLEASGNRCRVYEYDGKAPVLGVHRGPVYDQLESLGLLVRDEDKFVPPQYLTAGEHQRRDLLAGLLDTDGHASRAGMAEFTSIAEPLADAVCALVRSLGGRAAKSGPRVTSYTHNGETRRGQPSWRVHVTMDDPFRTPRKREAQQSYTRQSSPSRAIESVVPAGRGETICISVEADDSLYLTGTEYVVTHNTVVTIAVIEHLLETGRIHSALVICDASLKYQWRRKIEEFTDGAEVVLVDGPPEKRAKCYDRFERVGEYALMNYEQVVNDWERVKDLPAELIVCDEVQAIKNFDTLRSQAVKELTPPWRFGLTGQPVENRPEEAFSIMEWVDGTVLGHFKTFDKTFVERNRWGAPVAYPNPDLFHETISEAMFRVSDEDLADQLPEMTERVMTVPLSSTERHLYKVIGEELLGTLYEATRSGGNWSLEAHYGRGNDDGGNPLQGEIMTRNLALRMLCTWPPLLRLSAEKFEETEGENGSSYAWKLLHRDLLDDLPSGSKMKRLVSLVQEWTKEDDDRNVVVFSFFKGALGEMHRRLGDASVIYSGDLTTKQKNAAHERFLNDPGCRVFLSSDAGGRGLDLPNADRLVNFDLPPSAGLLEQRNARIRRLTSASRTSRIISLLMEESVEVRQHEQLQKKAEVAAAFIDGKSSNGASPVVKMDVQTLTEHLENSLPFI